MQALSHQVARLPGCHDRPLADADGPRRASPLSV
jgi:hypothetical protein